MPKFIKIVGADIVVPDEILTRLRDQLQGRPETGAANGFLTAGSKTLTGGQLRKITRPKPHDKIIFKTGTLAKNVRAIQIQRSGHPIAGLRVGAEGRKKIAVEVEALEPDPLDVLMSQLRSAVVEAVEDRMDNVNLSAVASSFSSIDSIADQMVAALPQANNLDSDVGPFYDTAGLRTWLGLSRQAVEKRALKRDIVAVRTEDNHVLYPAFQFGKEGEFLPRLAEILQLIDPDDSDAWGSALWLNQQDPELGMTPGKALRDGFVDEVLELAEAMHAAWAS